MTGIESLRRDEFDAAILTLHCERPGLAGAELLAAIVNEANDAMARLKERGELVNSDEDEG